MLFQPGRLPALVFVRKVMTAPLLSRRLLCASVSDQARMYRACPTMVTNFSALYSPTGIGNQYIKGAGLCISSAGKGSLSGSVSQPSI